MVTNHVIRFHGFTRTRCLDAAPSMFMFPVFAGMFAAGKAPAVCACARVSQTQNCTSMIMTLTLCHGGDQMLQVLGCQATPEHGPHPSARQLLLSYGPTATSLVRRGGDDWEGGGCLWVPLQELLKQQGRAVCVHCRYQFIVSATCRFSCCQE